MRKNKEAVQGASKEKILMSPKDETVIEGELEGGAPDPEVLGLSESLNLDEAAREWNPDAALANLEINFEAEALHGKAALEEAMDVLENRARLEAENLESIDAEIEASVAAGATEPNENEGIGEPEAALAFNPLDLEELRSNLEALFFMTDKSLSTKTLHELLGPTADPKLFEEVIREMIEDYSSAKHGIELVPVANGFQFRTKPGKMDLAQKLARQQIQRLSRGALETLAIVAYQQPTPKDEVDRVRGVDSSHFIRTLLDKKLIEISGRSDAVGRPMLYTTTDHFLEVFGLNALADMPPLREIEAMVPNQVGSGEEPENVKTLKKLVREMTNSDDRIEYDSREDDKISKDIRDQVKAISITTPYLEELTKPAAPVNTLANAVLGTQGEIESLPPSGVSAFETESVPEARLAEAGDKKSPRPSPSPTPEF